MSISNVIVDSKARQPLRRLHLVTMFFQLRSAGSKRKTERSSQMITGGRWRHKYPLLLIVRTIKRWEWKNIEILHNVCGYRFDDYIYMYMTAVPFNCNDIFKKQLNSITIGQHKTTVLKSTQIKNRAATYPSTVIDYPINVSVNMTDLMITLMMCVSRWNMQPSTNYLRFKEELRVDCQVRHGECKHSICFMLFLNWSCMDLINGK